MTKDSINNVNGIVKKEYRETVKFNDWARYFMDAKNKETYGNATRSALKVYDTDNYHSAGQIGHENLKKLEILASIYAESKGVGFYQMIDIALARMAQARSPVWWDRLMKLFGYGDFMATKESKVNPGVIFKKEDYSY